MCCDIRTLCMNAAHGELAVEELVIPAAAAIVRVSARAMH
jgi:hypothetical protein